MSDKIKKEKIFINAMDSWFSNFLIETFRTDHLPESKFQTEFMGTINDKIKNHLPMYFKPKIFNFDYNTSYKSDIFTNDILIYNLNTGCIKEIDYIFHGLKTLKLDSEKILIIISNIMTWGKNKDKIKTDNPDEIIFIHPEDIKKDKPKEEIKENEEKKEENPENSQNNTKSLINEQNKTNEEINKENKDNKDNKDSKNEIKEKELSSSKAEQEQNINLSKKLSKKTLDEIKVEKEENKPVIVYYTEKDYLKRKPNQKYLEYKYIENEALLLNQKNNVKAYVICPGIIYGYGEKTFYSIFRNAILNLPIEEILLDKGRNIIPTIHMRYLINIISKIIEKKPNSYYLLAFDQSTNRSLKYIIQSIYDCIGDINKMMPPKEEEPIEENEENKEEENKAGNEEIKDINNNNKVENNENNNEGNNNEQSEKEGNNNEEKKIEEQIQEKKRSILFTDKKYNVSKYFPRELLSINLKILPSEFLKGEPKKSYYSESDDENKEKENKNIEYTPLFKWHAPQGIVSNSQSIRKEFIRYRNLNSNKILILGNPYTGKTELSTILSKIFHLPIINSKNIADFGKKIANIGENANNENNENEFQGNQRRNSIEKDLIYDIQRIMKELDEGKPLAEENYNKRKDKKKTDPPFDENMYYRFNDEMMVRIVKRRLQENDTYVYGYILDGFPKNHLQAQELFEDVEKSGMNINSIIIFDNVEDDFLINRIKNSESFPKESKDPQAVAILDRANRRLTKIKENKNQEGYKDLIEFFKDEKFSNFKILFLDPKKEIIDIVKEAQEFIINNNENKINQIDEMLNCTDYQYDYIKEQEEIKKQKEEELRKEMEENEKNNKDKKGADKDTKNTDDKNAKKVAEEEKQEEKIEEKKEEDEEDKAKEENKIEEKKDEEKKENEVEEEKKEEEIPKTQYEIEKENEFKLLEKKSEVLRRYLAENVLPILSLGILHVASERPEDPVEALADFLLAKTFENEKEEKKKKNNDNKNKEEKSNEEKNNGKNLNEEINNQENNNENKNENKANENVKNEKEEEKIEKKNMESLEKKTDSLELDFNINEAKEF